MNSIACRCLQVYICGAASICFKMHICMAAHNYIYPYMLHVCTQKVYARAYRHINTQEAYVRYIKLT